MNAFLTNLNQARYCWERMDKEDVDVVSKEYFVIGDLVDMKITEPDKINDKFILMEGSIPPDSYVKLTDELLGLLDEQYYDIDDKDQLKDALKIAQKRAEVYSNWGINAVIKNFEEKCTDYFKRASAAKDSGKTLYTTDQDREAEELKNTLVNGRFTSQYFDDSKFEFFDQVVVFWEFNNVKFKNKIDRVIVDHEKKIITLTDIKTYYGNFLDSYFKYRYWLQGILYKAPFMLYEETYKKDVKKFFKLDTSKQLLDLIIKGYKINPSLYFLTVDKSKTNVPIPFGHVHSPLDTMSFWTYSPVNRCTMSRPMPGWADVAKELNKHIEQDQWEYSQELLNNESILL